MGGHGAPRPLASDPGSRTGVSWPGTMLAVPTTGTPFPHKNPQRQVIPTCLLTQQLSRARVSENMQAGRPEMCPKPTTVPRVYRGQRAIRVLAKGCQGGGGRGSRRGQEDGQQLAQ